MKLLVEIFNGWKSLTNFEKNFILDVSLNSEYSYTNPWQFYIYWNIIDVDPLTPGAHKKVTHTYINLQLTPAGLFKYV